MGATSASTDGIQDTPAQQRYAAELHRRVRLGNAGALLRTWGIQALWIIVILSGAGVPLNEALDGPYWVGPVLGFLVVVAAGIERVFGRTTPAAAAQDVLRRGLAREQRLFDAGVGDYRGDDAFERYLRRCEELISAYDESMLDYSASLARRSS